MFVCLFICDRGKNYKVSRQSPIKGVRPNPYAPGVSNSEAGIIILLASTDGLTVLATGLCLIYSSEAGCDNSNLLQTFFSYKL